MTDPKPEGAVSAEERARELYEDHKGSCEPECVEDFQDTIRAHGRAVAEKVLDRVDDILCDAYNTIEASGEVRALRANLDALLEDPK